MTASQPSPQCAINLELRCKREFRSEIKLIRIWTFFPLYTVQHVIPWQPQKEV